MAEAVAEVCTEGNPARLRSNPRVLKHSVLAYPPKRQKHARWPQPTKEPADAVQIVLK